MKPKSQVQQVTAWLNRGYSLTQAQAAEKFNCYRLAAVINKLRNRGMSIMTLECGKTRFAKYKLEYL